MSLYKVAIVPHYSLYALCAALMADDQEPHDMPHDAREELVRFADYLAKKFGYDNWMAFYLATPAPNRKEPS